MKRAALLGLLLPLVLACGEDEPDVPWQQYAPEVRERVEAAIASGDCAEMGDEWTSAHDGSDAHRAKYGDGNLELMQHISDAMEEAGCH